MSVFQKWHLEKTGRESSPLLTVLAPVSSSPVKSAPFISSRSMPGFSSQISVLLSFPVYCRAFQNLMFFLIKLLICCEHIAFQVSLQLAKQIKLLNPSLQSVLSCPQNILWLFFCTLSLFIIPLMCVAGLSIVIPRSQSHLPAPALSSVPISKSSVSCLAAEPRGAAVLLRTLNPGQCWGFWDQLWSWLHQL